MDLILYKDEIIKHVAENACNKITNKIIRILQKMIGDLLSGDSGLKNVWDEVCVQVRHEHSVFWSLYIQQIEAIISDEVEKLDPIKRRAIWLQTDQGKEWAEEEEEYQEYLQDQDFSTYCSRRNFEPDINGYEIIDYILHFYIMPKADNWSNRRIEKFLDNDYE